MHFKWTYIAVCQDGDKKSLRQDYAPWKYLQCQRLGTQVQGNADIGVIIARYVYNLESYLVEESRGIGQPLNVRIFYKFGFLRETTRIIVMINPLCKGGIRVSCIHRLKISSLH